MLVKTYSAAVTGLEAITVTIEISMTRGNLRHLSGLADGAVKESYDRIKAAMENNGYKMPIAELTINMSPADLKKEGSGYDLPMAIGILASTNKVEATLLNQYMLVGELGLDGKLQPVRGVLPVAIRARAEKFKEEISHFDPRPLAGVVKTAYLRKHMRIASGKKVMSSDEKVLQNAGKKLFEEMAFALKTDLDTAADRFYKALEDERVRFVSMVTAG